MNGNFKVGEVLVGQNFIFDKEYNGMECVVIGGLQVRKSWVPAWGRFETARCYEVLWANGEIEDCDHPNLRRKQPASGELSILNMFVVAPPQHTKEIA